MNRSTYSGSPAVNSACPNRGSKSPFRHSKTARVNLQTRPKWATEELRTSVFLRLGVHNGRPVLNLILLCSTGILSMPSIASIQSIYLRFTFPRISSIPSLPPFPIRNPQSAMVPPISAPYIGDYRELSAFIFPPKTTQKLTINHN
jgi:hypothetical protein